MKTVLIFIWSLFILSPIRENTAVTIEEVPRFQTQGILNLTAKSQITGGDIDWEVISYTVDENTGEYFFNPDTVFAFGDTLSTLLIKYINKYSYYKIYAHSLGETDSIEIQAFNKGNRTKVLYQNPIYPEKPVPSYVILPNSYNRDSKLVMVMHGIERNTSSYADAWKAFANNNDYIVVAPEFSSDYWSSHGYILGNMFTGSYGDGIINPEEYWSFYQVEQIHDQIVSGAQLNNNKYIIWGHSAGAQFVHRLMIFLPDWDIDTAIAANAGWYTAPNLSIEYPWGLSHDLLDYNEEDVDDFVYRKIIIMRGTADTLRDGLNTQPLSEAQGRNRFERAGYFYNAGLDADPSTNWELIDVPNVGHNYSAMAAAAQDYLLSTTNVYEGDYAACQFMLYQNYPNPFNPSTAIRYSLPIRQAGIPRQGGQAGVERQFVTLKIYDILGNEVTTLVNDYKPAGIYEVNFNASGLSSGMYFYTLNTGKSSLTKKMILLK